VAICLAALLFAVYLFTYRGGFHSIDEVSMFSVTESMVKRGRFDTNQIIWTQWATSQREAQGFFGLDGNVYSKKGLALSLFAMPLYWLALHWPGVGMLQAVSLLNAAITAATGSLLYLYARRLAYSSTLAILLGLVFGLATSAWVYAKYLFSEPLAGLLLFSAAFFLLGYWQERRWPFLVGAGLAAGLAVVARANNVVALPVFAVYLAASCMNRTPGGALTLGRRWLGELAVFTASLAAACSVMALYNWARTGNPLQTGYDLTIFSPTLWLGLYKLLFSPLRGLFWFSPILLFSPIAFFAFFRRHRAEAGLAAAVVLINVLLFATWTSGEGLSWGSRFLVPILPFATLMLLAPLQQAWEGGRRVWFAALTVLGGLSFIVQVLGVSVNPWLHLAHLHELFGVEFLEESPALFAPVYSPIWGQVQQLFGRGLASSDLAWFQPWGVAWVPVALMLMLLALSAALLVWQHRSIHNTPKRPAIEAFQHVLAPFVAVAAAAIVALLVLKCYFTTDLQFGPPNDGLHRILSRLSAEGRLHDGVITLMPYHYHVPMNIYKSRQPFYGFSVMASPLRTEAERLLSQITSDHERLWLITSGVRPGEPSAEPERWLAQAAFKATDEWYDDFRLCLYKSPHGGMAQSPAAAAFSDVIKLEAFTVDGEHYSPGDVVAVAFDWLAVRGNLPNYTVFVHLVGADGHPVAQHDSEPVDGFRPTSSWTPGERITDRLGVFIPPDVKPGEYGLWAGLYERDTGQRLFVRFPSGRQDDHLVLSSIVVK